MESTLWLLYILRAKIPLFKPVDQTSVIQGAEVTCLNSIVFQSSRQFIASFPDLERYTTSLISGGTICRRSRRQEHDLR
jgi:hypothetical protein